ncbi:hypothetical protein BIY24_14160 [Halobacteriovorax marinus]|nr:RNA polymerase sigma factor [Halobacteriovorax marinus]ATH09048.1 hypothetical protein BIY24_14160 [Halobacteriovorax marinus]
MSKKMKWFTEVVLKHEAPLIGYVFKILRKRATSEEVTQESFLKLWREVFPNKEYENYPKAWLYRVCRNMAIDILRKDTRLVFDGEVEELISCPSISESVFDSSIILQEIGKLKPIEVEVMTLKFANDLSYKEISSITNLSVSNVGFIIHDCVKKVRAIVLKEQVIYSQEVLNES